MSKPSRRSLEAKENEQDFRYHQLEAEQERQATLESLRISKECTRTKRRREDSTERKKQVSAKAESRKQCYTPKELLALSAEDAGVLFHSLLRIIAL